MVGGDEDRDAPRLTDTCGIAGSGRSRGSCDDGVAGSGNCACYDNFSGSDCTEGTCPAGTIETAAFEGYFNVAECTSCDAGTYSAEGDDQCTNCDAGTFYDGKPRSASTEAYRKLDARLSEQSSSARDLMTTMLGANTVSAAELQKRKLATRDADESIQHLAFLFEERAAASRVHRI